MNHVTFHYIKYFKITTLIKFKIMKFIINILLILIINITYNFTCRFYSKGVFDVI